MQNIKNIIFDLGGVFIDIDYGKTEKAFIDLGVSKFRELYTQHHASELFEHLETGKLTASEFYEALRNLAKISLTDLEMETAWNAMLGNFYQDHLKWLETIREKYNIYLFSNTNIIHYNAFQKIYKDEIGETNFDDYFVKAYYSHDLGLRKPYPEAFRTILEKEKISPSETLFIDDTFKNIEGAKSAGLHTIFLETAETLISKVGDYLGSYRINR